MADPSQLGFPELANYESEIRQQINDLLYFGKAPFPLTKDQRNLLTVMRFHFGRQSAIPLNELCVRTGLQEREAKNLMRSLVVDYGVRIGAARQQPYGYYLVTTAEEAKEAAQVYESEIRELARRVRVLRGTHFVAELLGQIRLQMEEEKAS
jgi:hypothetical protein